MASRVSPYYRTIQADARRALQDPRADLVQRDGDLLGAVIEAIDRLYAVPTEAAEREAAELIGSAKRARLLPA